MRNRRKRPSVQELDERLAAAPDPEPGLRDRLVRAFSDLPVEYRAAVVLPDSSSRWSTTRPATASRPGRTRYVSGQASYAIPSTSP